MLVSSSLAVNIPTGKVFIKQAAINEVQICLKA